MTEDEDAVLLALAEVTGDLKSCVGGQEHVHSLLPVLAPLAAVEELTVRDQAVESLMAVIRELPAADVQTHVRPMVQQLVDASWFSPRISAAAIIPATIAQSQSTEDIDQLMNSYCKLSRDATHMVRRAAAAHIPRLSKALAGKAAPGAGAAWDADVTSLAQLVDMLGRDESDSVRLLAVENITFLWPGADQDQITGTLEPLLRALLQDVSWRVRWSMATALPLIAGKVDQAPSLEHAVQVATTLAEDAESEVRTAVATYLADTLLADVHDAQHVQLYLPVIRKLAGDSVAHVRVAVAAHALRAASLVQPGTPVSRELADVFFAMLQDASNSDVQLAAVGQVSSVSKLLLPDDVHSKLTPVVRSLLQHERWRVRFGAVKFIPLLAKNMPRAEFSGDIVPLCLECCVDAVHAIRRCAVDVLHTLVARLGSPWASEHILPTVQRLADAAITSNYLHRAMALLIVQVVGPVLKPGALVDEFLPAVQRLASDSVPNIRFIWARTVGELAPVLQARPDFMQQHVVRPINILCRDADQDVRAFAMQAASALGLTVELADEAWHGETLYSGGKFDVHASTETI